MNVSTERPGAGIAPAALAAGAEGDGMRLRVATYNVRKCIGLDWRRRPERVLAVIDDLSADIVALQEADKRFGGKLSTFAHINLKSAGWHALPIAPHDGGIGWHGNAVLVRDDIEMEDIHRVYLPALEPRGAVIVDLNVRGVALRAVGAHLGLTRGMRVRQAHHIVQELERLTPKPTIIMGDMNTWHPTAGCIEIFAQRYDLAPPRPTFHTSRPVAPLDRIAVSKGISVLEQGVMRDGFAKVASDHLPLWADIAVERMEPAIR